MTERIRKLKKLDFFGEVQLLRLLPALLLLLVCAPAGTALAHGGGTPQLVQAPSGPYQLYAWTNPDPARVGVLHVTVALVEPATQQPVMNAAVDVLADASQDGQSVSAPATHENAVVKTYYEADLDLPSAGPWQITITHNDDAGSGSASFSLDVQPAAFNWRPIAIGAVLAVIAAGAWFLLRNNAPSAV